MNEICISASEAKKDCTRRLINGRVAFTKLSAKTVSFSGFGYGSSVFVKIHGLAYGGNGQAFKAEFFADLPKPSAGGYCIEFAPDCVWNLPAPVNA